MTELKSLILKTMAAAGALLVMTSPASAYEPTARDLQQAAYAFLMGDWDYQFPMEGGETELTPIFRTHLKKVGVSFL